MELSSTRALADTPTVTAPATARQTASAGARTAMPLIVRLYLPFDLLERDAAGVGGRP